MNEGKNDFILKEEYINRINKFLANPNSYIILIKTFLFLKKDIELLREKLKELGFSEDRIDYILKNREL
jgi:hypothetical protein